MKALSIRAPWWWYILNGGKDIENRSWPTRVRGRVLVHAGKRWVKEDIALDAWDAEEMGTKAGVHLPLLNWQAMRECSGCIVGAVEIVDCVAHSDSPWFVGDYGFVLRNPLIFAKPIPFKGALGFFGVPDDLLRPK